MRTISAIPRIPQSHNAQHRAIAHSPITRPYPDTAGGGLFWLQPLRVQHQRIRDLATSRLNIEQISTICRLPLSQVHAILNGAA